MALDETKMVLTEAAAAELQRALGTAAVEEFLAPERAKPNIVGVGAGVKWKDGQPTGEQALVVLVTQKVEKEQLSADDLVPARVADMQTETVLFPTAYDNNRKGMQSFPKFATEERLFISAT